MPMGLGQGFALATLNQSEFVFEICFANKNDPDCLMMLVRPLTLFCAFECGLALKSLAKYF